MYLGLQKGSIPSSLPGLSGAGIATPQPALWVGGSKMRPDRLVPGRADSFSVHKGNGGPHAALYRHLLVERGMRRLYTTGIRTRGSVRSHPAVVSASFPKQGPRTLRETVGVNTWHAHSRTLRKVLALVDIERTRRPCPFIHTCLVFAPKGERLGGGERLVFKTRPARTSQKRSEDSLQLSAHLFHAVSRSDWLPVEVARIRTSRTR